VVSYLSLPLSLSLSLPRPRNDMRRTPRVADIASPLEKLADASRKKRMQEEHFNKSLEDPYRDDKSHGVTYSVTQMASSPPRSENGRTGAWTVTPASTWVGGGTAPGTPPTVIGADPVAPPPPPKGHARAPSASRTSFSRPPLGHTGTGSSQATSSVRAFGDSREHVGHAR